MDLEHSVCHCGRGELVAQRAQAFVAEHATPDIAYEKAIDRTIESHTENWLNCSFWDCISDYISLNYDLDPES